MAVPTRDFPDLFRAPGGVPAGTKCRRKADWVYLASQSPLHGCGVPPLAYCAPALGKQRDAAPILRSRARQAAKQNDAIRFTIPPAWLCHAVPPLHKGGCGVPPAQCLGTHTALPRWASSVTLHPYCAPAPGKQPSKMMQSASQSPLHGFAMLSPLCTRGAAECLRPSAWAPILRSRAGQAA